MSAATCEFQRPSTNVAALNATVPSIHGAAYDRLVQEIRSGRLIFRYFLGQTGGGSTALTHWLRRYFDLAISEADSFSLRRDEPPLNREDRKRHKNKMYEFLLDQYQEERSRKGGNAPISMVCKFMPHLWYNDDPMFELLALNDSPLWLIRHPALALSSWLNKRIDLLLSGQEVGVGNDLSPEDCDALRYMFHTRDYSTFTKSLWDVIKNNLYEGNVDQDTREYREYDRHMADGESVRLDRHRMVIRERNLREYNDVFVFLFKTWKGRIKKAHHNKKVPHILDFELFQDDPRGIGKSVIEKLWGVKLREEEKNWGRFVDAYDRQRLDHLSEILMEAPVSGGSIKKPTLPPIEIGRFPPFMRHDMTRGVVLWQNALAESGLKFPTYSHPHHKRLSAVFTRNCRIHSGSESPLDRFFGWLTTTSRNDVWASPGSFGLS